MSSRLVRPVQGAELARRLELPYAGPDWPIHGVASFAHSTRGMLSFIARSPTPAGAPSGSCLIALRSPRKADRDNDPTVGWIQSTMPRLDFVKALRVLDELGGFEQPPLPSFVDPSVVFDDHRYGKVNPASVTLGRNVHIGARTRIGSHVRIADNVTIGEDCWIKSGAVVGEDGFGFERDRDGTPLRMMHFGGVRIGDRVEVGSLTTVCRGTLGDTVIEDDAKIDDHIHVAHNVRIGRKVMIAANAEVSGSVVIEEEAWVSPGACIRDHVTIGAKAFIGLGAVVIRNVAANTVVVGNPAKPLEKR